MNDKIAIFKFSPIALWAVRSKVTKVLEALRRRSRESTGGLNQVIQSWNEACGFGMHLSSL